MAAPTDEELRALLSRVHTIAVVGLSDKPERDSNSVSRYLQLQGYRVVPVNPALPEVLGEKSYPSVSEIPPEVPIDLVDIFRRSDQVVPVVREAIARGVGAVWLQLGVQNSEAEELARARGIFFAQDLCIMQQHRRLGLSPQRPAKAAP